MDVNNSQRKGGEVGQPTTSLNNTVNTGQQSNKPKAILKYLCNQNLLDFYNPRTTQTQSTHRQSGNWLNLTKILNNRSCHLIRLGLWRLRKLRILQQ